MKIVRVVPIHKEGQKSDVINYRPISLLSVFSNNSLFDMQYGFRPGRSCEHALLQAQNSILNALSKKKVALLLLLDFSKAFDMVDHSILLGKLYHYVIGGIVHKWFHSYLANRKQFVTISGLDSSAQTQIYGVPQGSILGPLLFVIYINDLPGISELSKFILYADDANIILTGSTVNEVYEKVHALSEILLKWVDNNGLLLNLKKTKYMIFARQNSVIEREIKIANIPIERKTEARFLGVIIDEKLTWSKHIETIKSKMSRYLGIMHKIRNHIPIQAGLQIYHHTSEQKFKLDCTKLWYI